MRSRLQKILLESWRESLETDYKNQRINSERSLQASFWGQINKRFPDKNRKIFVEPKFEIRTGSKISRVFPDLVICNSKSIICVIELKYQPRAIAKAGKDLGTLEALAINANKLSLQNKRYRGTTDVASKQYAFGSQTLFVWAGVHKLDAKIGSLQGLPSFAEGIQNLKGNYLELHAETDFKLSPNIYKKNY